MNDFSASELRQVTKLWDLNMSAGNKVDRRTISSRRVQRWAVDRALCLWECKRHGVVYDGWGIPPWSCVQIDEPTARGPECHWTLRFRLLKDPYQRGRRSFSSERDLPVEVLWHYIKEFLCHDGTTMPRGFSINLCKEWLRLNIYEMGSRYDPQDKHMSFRVTCLERLQQAGYIILQTAGSIWQITVLERGKSE